MSQDTLLKRYEASILGFVYGFSRRSLISPSESLIIEQNAKVPEENDTKLLEEILNRTLSLSYDELIDATTWTNILEGNDQVKNLLFVVPIVLLLRENPELAMSTIAKLGNETASADGCRYLGKVVLGYLEMEAQDANIVLHSGYAPSVLEQYWKENPPCKEVQEVADSFQDESIPVDESTNGILRDVLQTLFKSDNFEQAINSTRKCKSPFAIALHGQLAGLAFANTVPQIPTSVNTQEYAKNLLGRSNEEQWKAKHKEVQPDEANLQEMKSASQENTGSPSVTKKKKKKKKKKRNSVEVNAQAPLVADEAIPSEEPKVPIADEAPAVENVEVKAEEQSISTKEPEQSPKEPLQDTKPIPLQPSASSESVGKKKKKKKKRASKELSSQNLAQPAQKQLQDTTDGKEQPEVIEEAKPINVQEVTQEAREVVTEEAPPAAARGDTEPEAEPYDGEHSQQLDITDEVEGQVEGARDEEISEAKVEEKVFQPQEQPVETIEGANANYEEQTIPEEGFQVEPVAEAQLDVSGEEIITDANVEEEVAQPEEQQVEAADAGPATYEEYPEELIPEETPLEEGYTEVISEIITDGYVEEVNAQPEEQQMEPIEASDASLTTNEEYTDTLTTEEVPIEVGYTQEEVSQVEMVEEVQTGEESQNFQYEGEASIEEGSTFTEQEPEQQEVYDNSQEGGDAQWQDYQATDDSVVEQQVELHSFDENVGVTTEWVQQSEPESGNAYWWNPKTNESRWDKPTEEISEFNEVQVVSSADNTQELQVETSADLSAIEETSFDETSYEDISLELQRSTEKVESLSTLNDTQGKEIEDLRTQVQSLKTQLQDANTKIQSELDVSFESMHRKYETEKRATLVRTQSLEKQIKITQVELQKEKDAQNRLKSDYEEVAAKYRDLQTQYESALKELDKLQQQAQKQIYEAATSLETRKQLQEELAVAKEKSGQGSNEEKLREEIKVLDQQLNQVEKQLRDVHLKAQLARIAEQKFTSYWGNILEDLIPSPLTVVAAGVAVGCLTSAFLRTLELL